MTLSRGAWIALAAVIAVPATVAIAKNYDNKRWEQMSPETRSRLDDGKLAMAKTALKLTPQQETLWAPVEAEVRNAFKMRQQKMAERQKMRAERKARGETRADDGKPGDFATGDLSERFEKMSVNMTERAEQLRAFSTVFKPFYGSLSDEQRAVLRPLVRDLAPGFGPRGERGRKRWAQHGWNNPRGRSAREEGPTMPEASPAERSPEPSPDRPGPTIQQQKL